MATSYSNILNAVSSAATTYKGVSTKLGAITSSDGDNSAIRERLLNGFLGNPSQFTPSVFARMFDEPTYLTFRLEFDFNQNAIQNQTKAENWDLLPEPLLAYSDAAENWGTLESYTDASVNTGGYSTYAYLKNALGETQRAKMLKGFIDSLKDIQNNYAYYFKSIEGLNALSSVSPEQGIRVNPEKGTLTIKCYEGLDLKITQLMQLYKKIAWDDVYQRWILPDMMRYFTLRIYVSEIRLFHTMSKTSDKHHGSIYDIDKIKGLRSLESLGTENILNSANNVLNTAAAISTNMLGDKNFMTKIFKGADATVSAVDTVINSIRGNSYLCDNAINEVMPTMCFECHLCEFDITDTLSHISSLSSSNSDKSASMEPSIKIKVGKLLEKMIFPLQSGLTVSGTDTNKYALADSLINKFIDDEQLKREATYRIQGDEDYYFNKARGNAPKESTSTTSPWIPLSSKQTRINESYSKKDIADGLIKEYYDPFSPDKGAAAIALFTGVANLVFPLVSSTAIDGEVAQRIRQHIANNNYSPTDVISAATTIKSAIDFAMENTDVSSMATSKEMQDKLRSNIVVELLENIEHSAATKEDNKILSDLASFIKQEAVTSKNSVFNKPAFNSLNDIGFSEATRKRNIVISNQKRDSFSYLN